MTHAARRTQRKFLDELARRREEHNKLQDSVGALRVACRVRPLTSSERKSGAEEAVAVERSGLEHSVSVVHQNQGDKEAKTKTFEFTHCYGPDSKQEDVFADQAPLMISVLDGYNVSAT